MCSMRMCRDGRELRLRRRGPRAPRRRRRFIGVGLHIIIGEVGEEEEEGGGEWLSRRIHGGSRISAKARRNKPGGYSTLGSVIYQTKI